MMKSMAPTIAILLLSLLLGGCFLSNESPRAAFVRTPPSGTAPLAVYFDAAGSFDPDGVLVSYAWSFGDGSNGTGLTLTHTYNAPGTYEVVLTVTDDRNAQAQSSRMITVTSVVTPPEQGVEVGQEAPDFTLKDLDGVAVSLRDFRGYVVLLDFWASTCTPCRLTMSHLATLEADLGEEGLVVVGVSLDQNASAASQFLEQNGYTEFVILHDSPAAAGQAKNLFDIDAIPYTFVIDRQGIIRHADHPIRLRLRHIEPWL